MNKPLRHCTHSDLIRHAEERSVRLSQAQRKFSVGLLEEAYKLSKRMGLTQAAKLSGVPISSLRHYAIIRRREEGTAQPQPARINKITPKQKQACYNTFRDLYRYGFSKSKRKCWIEAGKRNGVNGRSVEFQFVRGLWKP